MAKAAKNILEPVALMCKGEHSKAARELLTRVGDKWSILLVVMLARTSRNRVGFQSFKDWLMAFLNACSPPRFVTWSETAF